MKKMFTLILAVLFSCSIISAQVAPDFTFTDTDGNTHTLSESLADGKVIFLDFFFVNCPPCVTWAPEIEEIIADFQGTTLEVWAISDRDNNEAITNSIFASSHDNHFVGGSEGSGDAIVDLFAGEFNFTGFPTYAVICNDGSITWDVWPISEGAEEIRAYLTEDCGVVDFDPTSVTNIEGLGSISLFPNPTSENVALNFSLASSTKMNIDVFNTLGQKVLSLPAVNYNSGEQTLNLNVAGLAKGIYQVRMQSKTGINSLSLMIDHQ